MDPFVQTRRADGSIPISRVTLGEEECGLRDTCELRFELLSPLAAREWCGESSSRTIGLVDLANLAGADEEQIATDVMELAISIGPLFGRAAVEHIDDWLCAARVAKEALELSRRSGVTTGQTDELHLTFPVTAAYAEVLGSLPLERREDGYARCYITCGPDGNLEVHVDARDSHAPERTALQMLVAAHLSDARVDLFRMDGSSEPIAFGSCLSWLWYDLSRQMSDEQILYCDVCGRAFSLKGHRGMPRRYCSEECRTHAKNRRNQKLRDAVVGDFLAGEEVVGIARRRYPAAAPAEGEKSVRNTLSHADELRDALVQSLREGGLSSPLLRRCQQEGLDTIRLLRGEGEQLVRRLMAERRKDALRRRADK